jgi:transposase-like protein
MKENGEKKRRRRHSPEMKVRVALEAIREKKTINQIASESGIHSTQVSAWKREAIEALPKVLGKGAAEDMRQRQELESGLYEEIGRLKYELDWLKKNMELWLKRTAMPGGEGEHVDVDEPTVPNAGGKPQLFLLHARRGKRGGYAHHASSGRSLHTLALLWSSSYATGIDEPGFYSQPQTHSALDALDGAGSCLSQAPSEWDRAEWLCVSLPVEGNPSSETQSGLGQRHHLYPNAFGFPLPLRDLGLVQPLCDLLGIVQYRRQLLLPLRLAQSVGNGVSRKSATPTRAASLHWTRGSVKYEEVYLYDYDSASTAWKGLNRYFRFYNHERPHQSLDYNPPAAVYFK